MVLQIAFAILNINLVFSKEMVICYIKSIDVPIAKLCFIVTYALVKQPRLVDLGPFVYFTSFEAQI